MRWEVKREGRVVMWGSEGSFPDREQCDQMMKAGYKIYVDGKVYKRAAQKAKGG